MTLAYQDLEQTISAKEARYISMSESDSGPDNHDGKADGKSGAGGGSEDPSVRNMGEFLSEEGYLEEREAEAVDQPLGETAEEVRREGTHETVNDLTDMLTGARQMDAPTESDSFSFSEAQAERAVSVAKLDCQSIENAAEAERKAKNLHERLGADVSDTEREAIDAYRNRAAELRGIDLSVIGDSGVPDKHDPRVRTDPRPTQFEKERKNSYNSVSNRLRRLKNKRDNTLQTDLNRQAKIEKLEKREKAIENAETPEELRKARSVI
jgi:hypothetical protein